MTSPRVTVLMAFHNGDRHLGAAIDSILLQTFRDFELVLVDDGSTDRSRAIAASYADPRIRLLPFERNRGLPVALNEGLRAARGEFVARLDSDDAALPHRLETQVAFLDAHPEIAVVGSQAIPIDERGKTLHRVPWFYAQWTRPENGDALAWYRMFDTPFVHSSVMFRRAAVDGYDERFLREEDAELWMRIGRRHGLANLPQPLVAFRLHPHAITRDPARRDGYVERKTRIVHTLLCEGLEQDVPERVARLWTTANDPGARLPAADLRELARALDGCAARFFALHPAARSDGRIARHRASMSARLAEHAIAADRVLALSLFAAMVRLHAGAALRALPRLAALFILGGRRR